MPKKPPTSPTLAPKPQPLLNTPFPKDAGVLVIRLPLRQLPLLADMTRSGSVVQMVCLFSKALYLSPGCCPDIRDNQWMAWASPENRTKKKLASFSSSLHCWQQSYCVLLDFSLARLAAVVLASWNNREEVLRISAVLEAKGCTLCDS